MTTTPITRVDLEQTGFGLHVRQWAAGWQLDGSTPADLDEYLPDTRVETLLAEYERQGFTVWMPRNGWGRALRGQITRIDLVNLPNGLHYRKFPYGWTAHTPPMTDDVKTAQEAAEILEWCATHGWTILRAENGARAWKGQPLAVVDKPSILQLRRKHPQSQCNLALYAGIL